MSVHKSVKICDQSPNIYNEILLKLSSFQTGSDFRQRDQYIVGMSSQQGVKIVKNITNIEKMASQP